MNRKKVEGSPLPWECLPEQFLKYPAHLRKGKYDLAQRRQELPYTKGNKGGADPQSFLVLDFQNSHSHYSAHLQYELTMQAFIFWSIVFQCKVWI